MKGFKNALVYLTGKGISKMSIGVEDGKIKYIGNDSKKITEPFEYNEGDIVLPGFIDEHIHGANGSDAMDGKMQAIANISTSIVSEGVTGFLATTMTESEEKIVSALQNIGEYIEKDNRQGARVLGVHLEGPFIAPIHCGAQDPKFISKPSISLFENFNNACKNNVKYVTLAPEEDDENLIKYLTKKGITVGAGHTDSTYNCIFNAVKNGLKSITHTYNVQKPLHHREVGTVGSAMLFDELYTECICDTIHISIPAIKLLYKNKPKDKFVLVTDAMRAKNLPEGESELGGQKVIVKNGEARLLNGALAGSVLKMNIAIKNVVEKCGIPFESAVDCASINPANNLGISKDYGSIEVGKFANFAVMNRQFDIKLTVREGNVVFKA